MEIDKRHLIGDHKSTNHKEQDDVESPSEPAALGLTGKLMGLSSINPFHHGEDGHGDGDKPSIDGSGDVGRSVEEVGEHVFIVIEGMLNAVGTKEYPSHYSQQEGEEHLSYL